MGPNVVFFAWNRSIPGRERLSAEHFDDFVQYLATQKQKGSIQSFDVVLLGPHGGDMNGFFLLRGDAPKLDTLQSTPEWITHMIRAETHLTGCGAVRGHTGDLVGEVMGIWKKQIPA